MEDSVQWLRRKLDENPAVTQRDLAAHLNINPSVMSRMVAGRRKIIADEKSRIEDYFRAHAPQGFAEAGAEFESAPAGGAPIFEATAPTAEEWIIDLDAAPIDRRTRPRGAEAATRLYGFYAPNARFWPRFKTGEIVFVDPARPARPGDDVMILKKLARRAGERITLGELVERDASTLRIREYGSGLSRDLSLHGLSVQFVVARDA